MSSVGSVAIDSANSWHSLEGDSLIGDNFLNML